MTGILHIVVARKPIEGTIVENCLQWGCGTLNIDACRVTTAEKLTRVLGKTTESSSGWKSVKRSPIAGKDGGRWPANLILGHATGCVYKGTKKVKAVLGGNSGHIDGKNVYGKYGQTKGNGQTVGYADADGNETVEDWQCESDCAVKTMGEQSGERKTTWVSSTHANNRKNEFLEKLGHPGDQGYNDSGTASRFFFNFSEQESDE
jgi:hypothetical protein